MNHRNLILPGGHPDGRTEIPHRPAYTRPHSSPRRYDPRHNQQMQSLHMNRYFAPDGQTRPRFPNERTEIEDHPIRRQIETQPSAKYSSKDYYSDFLVAPTSVAPQQQNLYRPKLRDLLYEYNLRHECATRIQAWWRSYRTRKNLVNYYMRCQMSSDRFAIYFVSDFIYRYLLQIEVPSVIREVLEYQPSPEQKKMMIMIADDILLDVIFMVGKDVVREAVDEIVDGHFQELIKTMPSPEEQTCDMILFSFIDGYSRKVMQEAIDDIVHEHLIFSHIQDYINDLIAEEVNKEALLLSATTPLSHIEEYVFDDIEGDVVSAFCELIAKDTHGEALDEMYDSELKSLESEANSAIDRSIDNAILRYLLYEWSTQGEDFLIRDEAEKLVDQAAFDIIVSNVVDIFNKEKKYDPGSVLQHTHNWLSEKCFMNVGTTLLQHEIEMMEEDLDKEEANRRLVMSEKMKKEEEIARLAKEIEDAKKWRIK